MRGAGAWGGFIALNEAESYAVEYWPREQYKLKLAPPEREFARHVVLVTGAAGGLGSAICRRVAQDGAQIGATHIDPAGAGKHGIYPKQPVRSGRGAPRGGEVTNQGELRGTREQGA